MQEPRVTARRHRNTGAARLVRGIGPEQTKCRGCRGGEESAAGLAPLPLVAEAAHQAGKREGDENGESKQRVHDAILAVRSCLSKTPTSGIQSTIAKNAFQKPHGFYLNLGYTEETRRVPHAWLKSVGETYAGSLTRRENRPLNSGNQSMGERR